MVGTKVQQLSGLPSGAWRRQKEQTSEAKSTLESKVEIRCECRSGVALGYWRLKLSSNLPYKESCILMCPGL